MNFQTITWLHQEYATVTRWTATLYRDIDCYEHVKVKTQQIWLANRKLESGSNMNLAIPHFWHPSSSEKIDRFL